MIDLERMQRILIDIGTGKPARGYTEEEILWRTKQEAEFDRWKESHPNAYIDVVDTMWSTPSDRGDGYDPDEPRAEDGKWTSGGGGPVGGGKGEKGGGPKGEGESDPVKEILAHKSYGKVAKTALIAEHYESQGLDKDFARAKAELDVSWQAVQEHDASEKLKQQQAPTEEKDLLAYYQSAGHDEATAKWLVDKYAHSTDAVKAAINEQIQVQKEAKAALVKQGIEGYLKAQGFEGEKLAKEIAAYDKLGSEDKAKADKDIEIWQNKQATDAKNWKTVEKHVATLGGEQEAIKKLAAYYRSQGNPDDTKTAQIIEEKGADYFKQQGPYFTAVVLAETIKSENAQALAKQSEESKAKVKAQIKAFRESQPGDFDIIEDDERPEFDKQWEQSWWKRMDSDHRAAVDDYTGSAFSVNTQLRDGWDPANMQGTRAVLVKRIDAALDEAKVDRDLMTYRGIGIDGGELDLKPGGVFEDSGFMSTSVSETIAADFAAGRQHRYIMAIEVPKGAKAAYIGTNSSHPDEHEMLLPRGSKLEIIEVQKTTIGGDRTISHVRARYIGDKEVAEKAPSKKRRGKKS
ncbi:MAG TPA: ADP-ribosyltransferase [Kofleriaceae bacterium]|jgi:hypothetical protein|nr:ADP-ribosyltransferase [Kofleriaceae bacterium]